MKRRIATAVIAGVICLTLLVSGCATIKGLLQKGCDNQELAMEYKAQIKAKLAQVQVGYGAVCAVAGLNNAPEIGVYVAAIDNALDVIGSLLYDKICPTFADVQTAEGYVEVAETAKAEMGIVDGVVLPPVGF